MNKNWFVHKYRPTLTSGDNTVVILSDKKSTETLANGVEMQFAGGGENYAFALMKGNHLNVVPVGEVFINTDRVPRDIEGVPIPRLI